MKKTFLNNNGQSSAHSPLASIEIKAIHTLCGIIMGITADQIVTDSEIHCLDRWLRDNAAYTKAFPLNIIQRRLHAILEEGLITQEEREDLYQTLIDIQGNDFHETGTVGGAAMPCSSTNLCISPSKTSYSA